MDQEPDRSGEDWFRPAILSEGGVKDSLRAVHQLLSRRRALVSALYRSLCQEGLAEDRVTTLGREARELETTLRYRLGVLRPEREGGWFRPAPQRTAGPVATTVLPHAVFGAYEYERVDAVARALHASFEGSEVATLPWSVGDEPTLWGTLIQLRTRLTEACRLPEPFSTLSLETLPDGLPEDLKSWSLEAFLRNVRREVQGVRVALSANYQILAEACDRLWDVQRLRLRAEDLKRAQEEAQARQRARFEAHTHDTTPPGADARSRGTLRTKLPADLEALNFMGFGDFPDRAELRQRYLALAKEFHPDRKGGDEAAFKRLNRSYRHLERRLIKTAPTRSNP